MMKTIAALAVTAAAALAVAPSSEAFEDYSYFICDALDRNPNSNGVVVVALELFTAGMSSEEAAELMMNSVLQYCPRNVLALQEFAEDYGTSVA
jgi:predicted nicotinamide N-methyase